MIALLVATLLAGQVPSPPTEWTRDDVENLWGPPTFSGPLRPPWAQGSTVASYVHRPDEVEGLCRTRLGTAKGLIWAALVYYTPAGRLVSVHCLQLGDLSVGHDVLPDVDRRLRRGRT